MSRMVALCYGAICYLIFFGAFLYAIGFVGNLLVPKSIDVGPEEPATSALIIDLALLGLFAVPHSVMARQGFKRLWTRIIPPVVERSTYVLVSSLLLALLYWQWRPLPELVWDVPLPVGRLVLHALFWIGWGLVLVSTFLTNHFDLFGLRQVFLHARGRPYTPVGFQTPFLYRYVRHPLLLGFVIAFWATPVMSVGHLLFAAATSAYMLIAIQLEERDLVSFHGAAYEEYRKQVGMLLPLPRGRGFKNAPETAER